MDLPIHPMQAMADGISEAAQKQRAGSQFTLGAMIAFLEKEPPEKQVYGLGDLMSYRGYYRDLAFDPIRESRAVAQVLAECRAAMGKVFEGYKGGEFVMGERTPLWVAPWGSCGDRLMGMHDERCGGPLLPLLSPDE